MEQQTEAWYSARLGKATASRIADATARTKSGWGASRSAYMAELITERLTGNKAPGFTSAAIQHGIDTEPMARVAYEFFNDVDVEEVGFIPHPRIDMSGASPDGLVGQEGLVEIKAPNTSTHINTLLGASIPRKYMMQMWWQMTCTGRQWCDFVSYDPRLPEAMAYYCQRVERDDETIETLESDIESFLEELETKILALQSKYAA